MIIVALTGRETVDINNI